MASEFSNFLHDRRIAQELTLRAFCLASGASSVYWSSLERGHAPAPVETHFYKKIKNILKLTEEEYTQLLKLKDSHTWTPEPPFF